MQPCQVIVGLLVVVLLVVLWRGWSGRDGLSGLVPCSLRGPKNGYVCGSCPMNDGEIFIQNRWVPMVRMDTSRPDGIIVRNV